MGMMGFTNKGPASGPTSAYDGSFNQSSTNGGSSTATTTFNTDGTVTFDGTVSNLSTPLSSSWYSPTTASIGNSYWLRATLSSGTLSSGTTGSWLALSSARAFSNTVAAGNTKNTVVVFEISSSATGTPIVATGTVTIEANGQ